MKGVISEDWIDDCEKYWGEVLTGRKAHWCIEWDFLPIDETVAEFEACLCFEAEKGVG